MRDTNMFQQPFFVFPVLAVCVLVSTSNASDDAQLPDHTGPDVKTLNCTETIKPDRLVISGGISAESVRPKQASDQIDLQLNAIRTYVKSKNGVLLEKERLRAARNPERERDSAAKLPFIQVQRFEAEFPLSVDVDDVLERLLKMGMDRYGKDANIDSYASREYKVLTSSRFSSLGEDLKAIRTRCIHKAAKQLCGEEKADACAKAMTIYSSSAQTEPVASRDGYKRSFNPAIADDPDSRPFDTEPLEPISANPCRVTVSVNVKLPPATVSNKK
jgi:hypothetical protein